ncbi:hypothetical protein BH09BAC2_BH09BAC2_00110 [soil metagenome]
MIVINLLPVMYSRGINRPTEFLIKILRLAPSTAVDLRHGRKKNLTMAHLEKLCVTLNCTPNDILEWHPDKTASTENAALNALKPKDIGNVLQWIHEMPYSKLQQLKDTMNNEKNI